MNTTPSFFSRCILLVSLCAVGCFPEQDPNADNGGAPSSGGTTSHPQGGKAATGKGGAQGHAGSDATLATGSGAATPPEEGGSAGVADDYLETRELVETCTPASAGISLPQRDAVTSDAEQTAQVQISVDDLWSSFGNHCGHCHVDAANGGYH